MECKCENPQMTFRQPGSELFTDWTPHGTWNYYLHKEFRTSGNRLRESIQNNSEELMNAIHNYSFKQSCTYSNNGPPDACVSKYDCNNKHSYCLLENPNQLYIPKNYNDSINEPNYHMNDTMLYGGGRCMSTDTYKYPEAENNLQPIGFHKKTHLPIQCYENKDCPKNEECNLHYNTFGRGLQTNYCSNELKGKKNQINYSTNPSMMRPPGAGIPIYAEINKCFSDADCRATRQCVNTHRFPYNLNKGKRCLLSGIELQFSPHIESKFEHQNETKGFIKRKHLNPMNIPPDNIFDTKDYDNLYQGFLSLN